MYRARLSGVITSWSNAARTGTITTDGIEYAICNARAFDTVLPHNLASLEGACALFEGTTAAQAPAGVARWKGAGRQGRVAAPLQRYTDLLGDEHEARTAEGRHAMTGARSADDADTLVASSIVVDLGTAQYLDPAPRPYVEEGVPPTRNVKDLRAHRVREPPPSGRRGRGEASAPTSVVVARGVLGRITAWSPVDRSGIVELQEPLAPPRESPARGADTTQGEGTEEASRAVNACVVESVDAFHTALPTSAALRGRDVATDVVLHLRTARAFAVNIVVLGEIRYALTKPSVPNPTAAVTATGAVAVEVTGPPPPAGTAYGVVTRWSGGQGVVECTTGSTYFVSSPTVFVDLVDATAATVRGAVVSFHVDAEEPRQARGVRMLSTPRRRLAVPHNRGRSPDATADEGDIAGPVDDPPLGPPTGGVLRTWSAAEGVGIVLADDGARYTIPAVSGHVAAAVADMRRGCRVEFRPGGVSGRVAYGVNVTAPPPTDAAATASAEDEVDSRAAPSAGWFEREELVAVASPTAASYWAQRMERSGFDLTEYTALKRRAANAATEADDNDDDDDPMACFRDSEWTKEMRGRGRLGEAALQAMDAQQFSPISMANVASKIRTPEKLQKVHDKYFNRLTEPMKEHAWQQAKTMGPRYAERIREARAKGEDPVFHFY